MSQHFGEYRLLRLMGEGGMAQVWSAQRHTLGGPMSCAVKIIRPRYANDPHYREMFQREARLSLALSGHGNVVTVFDVGVHEGRAYLAMELVDGVTLTELARRVGAPWPVAHAVYVVAGVLRALCHIHGHTVDGEPQGIVHRDVTPHNVMVSARGEVKLMDFGIAQRADAEPCLGGALGKLAYVPREQVEGDPDQRADLYAAGALLFELLDGRRFRWHCADEDAYFLEIYRDRVPSLRRKDIPPAVTAVLRGLLQPSREHRIATAAEALRMLESWSGFRWALTELEVAYAAAIGPRPATAAPAPAPATRAPAPPPPAAPAPPALPRRPSAETSARKPSASPGHRPWDDSTPPMLAVRGAAHDEPRGGDRSRWETTLPHAGATGHGPALVEADHTDRVPIEREGPAPVRRRPTVSVPAWAGRVLAHPGQDDDDEIDEIDEADAILDDGAVVVAVTDELPAPDELGTRLLPAAERNPQLAAEPIERLVTRRHPAALAERDVPSARSSAEIAVTQPTPSRQAPWATGTDPIEGRLVRPEPGAPVMRRRPKSNGSLAERTGSVAPRPRESASMHRVAAQGSAEEGVVAGEIVTEEGVDAVGEPLWRVSSR